MSIQINLHQLYVFYMVIEHGGIRAAAKILHVSPAAVTMQVKRLEQWLGFYLFKRHVHPLIPTDEALEMLPMTKEMFTLAFSLDAKLHEMMRRVQGEIRLGVHEVPAQTIIPTLLQYMTKKLPLATINIVVGDPEKTLQRIKNREIHIGLVGSDIISSEMEEIPFITATPFLAVCKNNPLGFDGPIPVQALENMPILLQSKASDFTRHVQKYAAESGVKFKAGMQNITAAIAKKIIPYSDYGAFFSDFSICEELQEGSVKVVQLLPPPPPLHLSFVCLRGEKQNTTMRQFLESLPSPEEFTGLWEKSALKK